MIGTTDLIDVLWPLHQRQLAFQGCAVVDAQSNSALPAMIRASGLDFEFLEVGMIGSGNHANAALLVRITSDCTDLLRLIDIRTNAIFATVRSESNFKVATAHFRSWLKICLDTGQTYGFRYYDPRVLGPYLNACNPTDLNCFLGPLDRCVFWDAFSDKLRAANFDRSVSYSPESRTLNIKQIEALHHSWMARRIYGELELKCGLEERKVPSFRKFFEMIDDAIQKGFRSYESLHGFGMLCGDLDSTTHISPEEVFRICSGRDIELRFSELIRWHVN